MNLLNAFMFFTDQLCVCKLSVAQVVMFFVVEPTHPGSNSIFDMVATFMVNYSFSGRHSF
jgi:hypothetical protein